jgi:hypothetical protein
MELSDRIEEAVKRVRLAKQEVEDPDVSYDLEHSLEALQDALESLEDD